MLADPAPASLQRRFAEADGEGRSSGGRGADGRLGTLVRYAIEEAEAAGASNRGVNRAVLTRLTELVYIEVVRRYAAELPDHALSWLSAVRHREIGHALRLMHEAPARRWSLTELGREVGLSRSALAERFRELTGDSPGRYLAAWRIQLAQRLLTDPSLSIAQVASRVGFGSAEAFHRAFKRHTGRSPASWRRGAS